MADDHDDGYRLLPSGLVRLVLGGQDMLLRRPTLGQLKELRTLAHQHSDQDVADAHMAQARTDQLTREWEPVDEQLQADADAAAGDALGEVLSERARRLAEYRQARRQVTRDLDPLTEARRAGWLRAAVTLLGQGAALPESDDDLPAWAMDANLQVQMLTHWITVPSGSGPS